MIIRCKIDLTKLDRSAIFKGEKGKYVDVTLLENRDGVDRYGNNFMVVQDIGKERREKGDKGPILGNGKIVGLGNAAPQTRQQAPTQESGQEDDDSDIPF